MLILGLAVASCVRFPEGCNGHVELCDVPFDQVAFAGTHNSMAAAEDEFIGPNQEFGIDRQLEDGIRALLLDTYKWNGDLFLCHSTCEIGATALIPSLRRIRQFLEEHPGEVLTIIFQDNISPAETEIAFVESGLVDFVYTHETGADWPTLGDMARMGTRVLVTAEASGPPPEWYQHAWDLIFDTNYSFGTIEEFSCDLNRGSEGNELFLLNHWISNPFSNPIAAAEANSYKVLNERAQTCRTEREHIPNFVTVDFYDLGDVFQVVDELNGF